VARNKKKKLSRRKDQRAITRQYKEDLLQRWKEKELKGTKIGGDDNGL